ncbi:hypothetical protein BGZ99_009292 [Dissophora globulifera]|uniref:Uncharacterized protein n=1 Tax=Dissophora globulifera TaxID=979702 RepID=A0A9P6UZ11_9FUNG|nr:hypothetical protein BGZ99_009292 [Dissophora globulifera]
MVIMGTVGFNGDFENDEGKGCMLYMTIIGDAPFFASVYCQFPVVCAAVIGVFSVLFLGYWTAVLHRYDEYTPVITSQIFMGFSVLMAVLSFAICGEIGIGLTVGCRSVAPELGMSGCQKATSSFQALNSAQICAGLMGGFWIIAVVLEYFQFRYQPAYEDSYGSQQNVYDHNNQSMVESTV